MEHERGRLPLNKLIQQAKKAWHGIKLYQPDWGETSHSIAFTVELRSEKLLMHLILNAYFKPLDFELGKDCDAKPITWRR
jgi:glycogen operon protein